MRNQKYASFAFLTLLGITIFTIVGCAEGPLWKVSQSAPWVQRKWAEEDQIAESVYSKRARLRKIISNADRLSAGEAESVSSELHHILKQDPTQAIKIDAIQALGKLKTETAAIALDEAVQARDVDLRMAAVQSLKNQRTSSAQTSLISVVKSDQNPDVRRAAIASLSEFRDPDVVRLLANNLNDNDPATQLRVMESLASLTGKEFGADVKAWRQFLEQTQTYGNTGLDRETSQEMIADSLNADLPNFK